MKLADIKSQLIVQLPKLTNAFSDTVAVTIITRTGSVATVTTASPHGLTTGRQVVISGAEMPVPVTSLTRVGSVATGVTSEGHDLTELWNEDARIEGADQAAYNLTLDRDGFDSPNRLTFKYSVSGTPTTPATGTILLYDGKNRGYNGLKTVTVTGTNTFTFAVTGTPISPAKGTILIHKGFRIAHSVDFNRFLEVYSKQPDQTKVWLCVVMGDTTASASRFLQNDATDLHSPMTEYRQKLIERFSIYIIIPTTEELAGAEGRDRVETLKSPIFRSILGVKFPSYLSLSQQYGATFVTSQFVEYNGAYYVHEMQFEQVAQLVQEDLANTQETVAFRDITLQFQNENNSVIMTSDINLDDEPI